LEVAQLAEKILIAGAVGLENGDVLLEGDFFGWGCLQFEAAACGLIGLADHGEHLEAIGADQSPQAFAGKIGCAHEYDARCRHGEEPRGKTRKKKVKSDAAYRSSKVGSLRGEDGLAGALRLGPEMVRLPRVVAHREQRNSWSSPEGSTRSNRSRTGCETLHFGQYSSLAVKSPNCGGIHQSLTM
jgi:hypothetical protein